MFSPELHLHQEARLKQFEFEVKQMSRKDLEETLLGAARLMFQKDNVINGLTKRVCGVDQVMTFGESGNDSDRR